MHEEFYIGIDACQSGRHGSFPSRVSDIRVGGAAPELAQKKAQKEYLDRRDIPRCALITAAEAFRLIGGAPITPTHAFDICIYMPGSLSKQAHLKVHMLMDDI